MYLIQLLLPLYDNDGEPLPKSLFAEIRDELVQQFGGLTAYSRAPAHGLWSEDGDETVRDDLVVHEVMAEGIDRAWWQTYRASLEARLRQEEVLIRAHPVEML